MARSRGRVDGEMASAQLFFRGRRGVGDRREHHELPALTDEEYSAADEQPAGTCLHDLCEGGMEFTLVGGVHHQDLPSDGTSRFLQVSRLALDIRTVWVALAVRPALPSSRNRWQS
jgi:hypothetical protein